MKKYALILILCLLLSGCGKAAPEKTADGADWDEGWTTIGNFLGVELSPDWTMRRDEDLLTTEWTCYCSWTQGEGIAYTDEAGDEVTTYDAQIHLVIKEFEAPSDAELTAALWRHLAQERYPDLEQSTAQYAGQSFDISTYPFPAGNGPASLGASATGVRGGWAIQVDVLTLESFPQTPSQVLEDFLTHCHYAE